MTPTFAYHKHFEAVQAADLAYVRKKDVQYNASWKQRGGPGAFFTIARPWDRFETLARAGKFNSAAPYEAAPYEAAPYDVFGIIAAEGLQGPDGSLIACIRDLRRYLLLLECEAMEQATPKEPVEGGGPSPYIWSHTTQTPKYEVPEKPWSLEEALKREIPSASDVIISGTIENTEGPLWEIGEHGIPRPFPSSDSNLVNYGVGEGTRMRPPVLDEDDGSAFHTAIQPPAPPSSNPLVNGRPQLHDRPCWDLQDGLTLDDIAAAEPGFYQCGTVEPPTHIVNRHHGFFNAHPATISHLPRLDLELNAKELSLLAPHYRHLYKYIEAETKYRLASPYQNKMWMK